MTRATRKELADDHENQTTVEVEVAKYAFAGAQKSAEKLNTRNASGWERVHEASRKMPTRGSYTWRLGQRNSQTVATTKTWKERGATTI